MFTIRVGTEVIVEEGRRITARHVREMEQKGVKRLEVPKEYPVSYTHLRAHETVLDLVCRLLLEKKKERNNTNNTTPQDSETKDNNS